MVNDLITNYLFSNVWSILDQDKHKIFKLTRLTKQQGVLRKFFGVEELMLPSDKDIYHLFSIGNIKPKELGLLPYDFEILPNWYNLKDSFNTCKSFLEVYTEQGVQVSKNLIYSIYTKNRNLIIAIKYDDKIPVSYGKDTFYFRTYRNSAHEKTDTRRIHGNTLFCESKKIKNNTTIGELRTQYDYYKTLFGLCFYSINGVRRFADDFPTLTIGDQVDFIYDGTVIRKVSFKLKNIRTFLSTLDKVRKYLIHYPKQENDKTVLYHDDSDVYVFNKDKTIGLYLNKNIDTNMRMVTHRDYSIPVNTVVYYTEILKSLFNVTDDIFDMNIVLYIRESGNNKPLVYEANRIHELYKLSDDKVIECLSGNLPFPLWKAESLENSDYCKAMYLNPRLMMLSVVEKSLGFNGITKVIGDTYQRTDINNTVNLSLLYMNNATCFEYDNDGVLLDFYSHNNAFIYATHNTETKTVETLYGKPTDNFEDIFGNDNININDLRSYRVFKTEDFILDKTNIWEDITGTDFYKVENNIIKVNGYQGNITIRVRSNKNLYCKKYIIKPSEFDNIIFIPLTETVTKDQIEITKPIEIMSNNISVILNGRHLVNQLDFVVKHNKLMVLNTKYLKELSEDQEVIVVIQDFLNPSNTLTLMEDSGFVYHNSLSSNNRFDIRDDKVMRITVDGKLQHKQNMVFSETDNSVNVLGPLNGLPYQIKELYIPVEDYLISDTELLKKESLVTDKKVSDFLTLYYPDTVSVLPSTFPNKYRIYSPFLTKLIKDMQDGILKTTVLDLAKNNNIVNEICTPYFYLLDFDLINKKYNVDTRFVEISPVLSDKVEPLTLKQYIFLQKVIKLYTDKPIDLSVYINLID